MNSVGSAEHVSDYSTLSKVGLVTGTGIVAHGIANIVHDAVSAGAQHGVGLTEMVFNHDPSLNAIELGVGLDMVVLAVMYFMRNKFNGCI